MSKDRGFLVSEPKNETRPNIGNQTIESEITRFLGSQSSTLKRFLDDHISQLSLQHVHSSMPAKTIPGLPYKQRCIVLTQHLHEVSEYSMSVVPNRSLSGLLNSVGQTINNIVEILMFMITELSPSGTQTITDSLGKVQSEFQILLAKQTEQLEQNRKNLKEDFQDVKDLAEKRYDALYKHQEVLLNVLNEKSENNQVLSRLDEIEKLVLSQLSSLDNQVLSESRNSKVFEEKVSKKLEQMEKSITDLVSKEIKNLSDNIDDKL